MNTYFLILIALLFSFLVLRKTRENFKIIDNKKLDSNKLLKKIKILKNNSDYAVDDIVNHTGERWEFRINKVLNDPKYKNTILNSYLKKNKNNNTNLYLLLECIKEYNFKNKLPIPSYNEIVIHLRMGDVVDKKWFLKNDFVGNIKNIIKNNTINKITIVTCFSYGVWSNESLHLRKKAPLWNYTKDKQNRNNKGFLNLLYKLKNNFNIPIDIYSNIDVDKDICYCVFSKHFIEDKQIDHKTGGFSGLMKKLNQINN